MDCNSYNWINADDRIYRGRQAAELEYIIDKEIDLPTVEYITKISGGGKNISDPTLADTDIEYPTITSYSLNNNVIYTKKGTFVGLADFYDNYKKIGDIVYQGVTSLGEIYVGLDDDIRKKFLSSVNINDSMIDEYMDIIGINNEQKEPNEKEIRIQQLETQIDSLMRELCALKSELEVEKDNNNPIK